MATLSNLRSRLPPTADLARAYGRHRPKVQRALTAGFVLYVIGTSYNAFMRPGTAGPSKRERQRRAGKEQEGRKERVQVGTYLFRDPIDDS